MLRGAGGEAVSGGAPRPDRGRRVLRRRAPRPGEQRPHDGRHRGHGRRRPGVPAAHRGVGRPVRRDTTTNARCFDFEYVERLNQSPENAAKERNLISCLREIGVMTTDTCINYQAALPAAPRRARGLGRHGHRDLRQLRPRRPLELRERAGRPGRRPDRTYARLRFPPRREPHRQHPRQRSKLTSTTWLTGAPWAGSSENGTRTTPRSRSSPASTVPRRRTSSSTSAPPWPATARWGCTTSSASPPRRGPWRTRSEARSPASPSPSPTRPPRALRRLRHRDGERQPRRVLRPAALPLRAQNALGSAGEPGDQGRDLPDRHDQPRLQVCRREARLPEKHRACGRHGARGRLLLHPRRRGHG